MPNEMITADGEIVETTSLQVIDSATLSAIEKAQIDTQVATARAYPRSIRQAIGNILSLATLDEQTAAECIYALKRDGKPLRGPSIRLAEIVAQQWGNNTSAARVVQIDRVNKLIVAEGIFIDMQTNSISRASVQRRISKRDGGLFSDDMIAMTGNAACSIAKRNAILAGVPKGVWRQAQEAAEKVIRGDVLTLVERRDTAVKAFAIFGLSADQVYQVMNVKGIDDINIDDLVTMKVIYTSLKSGEQTVEDLLASKSISGPTHKVVANPLSDDAPAEPAKADQSSPAADAPKNATPAASGAPAQSTTTNSPIAADASPVSGAQADPEKQTEAPASGSATDQAPADDDFPGDRPSTAATKAAGRKFIKNLVE
jgi:hypothetical protein